MAASVEVEFRGERFQARPVVPADEPLLVAGFEQLSEEARRMRFFVPTPRLSRSQVHYLTSVDQVNHVAVGVLDGGAPIAVGRYIRLDADPKAADVAITVADSHHRRGIGLFLVGALAAAAVSRGIEMLHFDVLAENEPMLRLLERVGARRTEQGALVHLVIEAGAIEPPAEAEALVGLLDALASV